MASIVILAGGGSFGINSDAPPVVAQVVDESGNPVVGTGLFFSPQTQSGGANGSVQFGSATTDSNGSGSSGGIVCNSNIGAWRVLVSSSYGIVQAQSVGFENTVPPLVPTSFLATQGSGQSTPLGSPFPAALQTRILDQYGAPMAGVIVTYYSPNAGPGCTWAGAYSKQTTTDVNGYATATVATAVGAVGNFNAQVQWYYNGTYGPIINIPQVVATNTPPVLTTFTVVGDGQIVPINTAFPTNLSATIKDQFGAPMAGLAVSFTCPASGASGVFTGATRIFNGTTNGAGVVTAPVLTSNATGGSFVCTVAQGAFTRPINLTIATGAPVATTIVPLQGDNQSAQVNTQFALNIYARVRDQYGNPIAGVAIASTVPGSGPSCTGLSGAGVSDGSGNFFVGRPTANAVVGSFKITTSVTALSATALPSNPFADRPRPRPVVPGVDVPDDGMPPQFSPRAFPSCTFNCTNTVGPPVPAQASLLISDV